MTSGPTSPSAHHHLPSRTCHVQAPELRECFPTLIPGMGGVVAVHAGFHKVLRWEAPGGVLLVLPHLISCCGSTAGKGQRRGGACRQPIPGGRRGRGRGRRIHDLRGRGRRIPDLILGRRTTPVARGPSSAIPAIPAISAMPALPWAIRSAFALRLVQASALEVAWSNQASHRLQHQVHHLLR